MSKRKFLLPDGFQAETIGFSYFQAQAEASAFPGSQVCWHSDWNCIIASPGAPACRRPTLGSVGLHACMVLYLWKTLISTQLMHTVPVFWLTWPVWAPSEAHKLLQLSGIFFSFLHSWSRWASSWDQKCRFSWWLPLPSTLKAKGSERVTQFSVSPCGVPPSHGFLFAHFPWFGSSPLPGRPPCWLQVH